MASTRQDTVATKEGTRRTGLLAAVAAVVLVLAGVGIVWHRRQDPARVWARTMEPRHVQHIDQPLGRCFGGIDGASVRQSIAPAHAGHLSPALTRCRGAIIVDVMTEPLALNADLGTVPGVIENARDRERAALLHLRSSLGVLTHIEERISASTGEMAANDRDALARALEDVAVDVDAERAAWNDVLAAAESGGSTL